VIAVNGLRVEFGARVLFDGLSFAVGEKERISFAGPNGAGKSTLMKCLGGILEPNAGIISKPKGFEVGYLPQEGIHIKGHSLMEECEGAFAEARTIQKRIDQYSAELDSIDPRSAPYADMLNTIGDLELKLEHFDPARIKPRIEAILNGLGFQREDLQRDCGEFSGGWQMRIAMAKLFLREPGLMLLDEPTNHLDIDAQRWMENFLENYRGAIILISHDLALLDSLTTRTIAFHHGRAEEYAGNYSFYLTEHSHRKEILKKQYASQQREIQKTQQWIDRFRSKASKASQVQSRVKQLEKMERITLEKDDSQMNFAFPPPPNSAHCVAKLEHASQSYGKLTVFKDLDIEINRGQKIAVVGPNGAGKSTFCRLVTGQEAPSAGLCELGNRVKTSFFSQNHADELDPSKTVIATVEEVASRETAAQVRNLLGCFLFRGDDVFKQVGILSGGERSRVALVRMLVRPANFLILDEPTNHLDVQSQKVLQSAIQNYEGTVIIVSHNRAFLDPCVEKTLEFRQGQDPKLYFGNLSYYLDKKEEEENLKRGKPAPAKTKASAPAAVAAPRLPAKERRKREAEIRRKRTQILKPLDAKLEILEGQISDFEAAKTTLTEHLSKPEISSDADELRKATSAYQGVADKLEKVFSEWSTLSDEAETLRAELDAGA
jgi:ATP-binding cassette subfamily F protein 3